MKKIVAWEAEDGTLFATPEMAVVHERGLEANARSYEARTNILRLLPPITTYDSNDLVDFLMENASAITKILSPLVECDQS